MKKIFVIMVALMSLVCFPIFAQAQTATAGAGATSNAGATAVGGSSTASGGSAVANPTINTGATASPTINITLPEQTQAPSASIALSQSTEAPTGGIYRQFMYPVQPLGAPIVPYLGPWKDGVNVLENLDFIPKQVTLVEAKNMAIGKVNLQVRTPGPAKVTYDDCRIIDKLPANFVLRGYIFSIATDEANTVDVIMHSYVAAMNNGANALYPIKKQSETESSSKGWQIGLGIGGSGLTGTEKDRALTGSIGFGFGGSKAKPIYKDGVAFMMIELPVVKTTWISPGAKAAAPAATAIAPVKPVVVEKKVAAIPVVSTAKVEVNHFRCVSTTYYTAPADCK